MSSTQRVALNRRTFGSAFVAVLFALTVVLVLVPSASAATGFEQVATFGEASETAPLYGAEGVAVNSTGAGGVATGTVYVAVNGSGPGNKEIHMLDAEGKQIGGWESPQAMAIAVDQATGDVYVRDWGINSGGRAVRVYSADGSREIASFGVVGNGVETIAESPEKVHEDVGDLGMTVDATGNVYVADNANHVEESRVMLFRPQSPGDYEHYVYAGRASDVGYTRLSEQAPYLFPKTLAVDAAGDLYMTADEGSSIVEFNPGSPTSPIGLYKVPRGGADGLAVDPQTDQVYYYTYKDKTHIYQLAPGGKGEFVATNSFPIAPAVGTTALTSHMPALAFNPVLEYEGVHPPGAIYAVSLQGVGYILAPPERRPSVVESTTTTSVTSSGALLGAVVNPKGFATHYAFQYIDDAAYSANEPGEPFAGAAEAPLGGGTLTGGTSGVATEAALSGLAANTTYHYRLVATSHCNPTEQAEICETAGPAQAFRTFPAQAGGLPDARAYELVSPALKSGGEVFPIFPTGGSCNECKPAVNGYAFPAQSSTDGEAVVFMGFPFSFTEGATQADEYIARRDATGWQTTTLSPELKTRELGQVGFDVSLEESVSAQGSEATLSPSAPSGYDNLYSQRIGEPTVFDPLVTQPPPDREEGHFHVQFAGGSADYSKLFFEANDALTAATESAPEAVDGGGEENDLYESADGSLRLVNVLPGNQATAPGAAIGKGPYIGTNTTLFDYSHAVSNDGSRVFWSDAAGQVYVREDGRNTREIPDHTGGFVTAAADGSKVLLGDGHLYDLENEQTVDLTEGQGGFSGIAGQSEDLSHVYFVDTQALTGQVNGNGEQAEAGKNNLYARVEGETTFIGRLLAGDANFNFNYGDWTAAPAERTAQASPDGRWLAFLSEAPLTGYDNVGRCRNGLTTQETYEGPCKEVYLYDSATGELTCASCDRSGLAPLGSSQLPLLLDAPSGFGQTRYLTDQGRLYFDSADSLSPSDSNDGVEDVYQYEPDEVGSCGLAEGCVNLISSGRGSYDSNFLAIDASGKNVFFTTRDQLVPVDHDKLMDLYDAREGGGIAAQSEVGQNSECQGEACQPPASGTGDPALSSLSFEGAGNPLAPAPPSAKTKKALSRAQRLARALSQCRHRPKRKRAACRSGARKRFAAKRARTAGQRDGLKGGR